MKRPLNIEYDVKQAGWKCPICGKIAIRRDYVVEHLEKDHGEEGGEGNAVSKVSSREG